MAAIMITACILNKCWKKQYLLLLRACIFSCFVSQFLIYFYFVYFYENKECNFNGLLILFDGAHLIPSLITVGIILLFAFVCFCTWAFLQKEHIDEVTQKIDARLEAEDRAQERTNKLLFLGPGGSGKSTIFKQFRWLHAGGFTKSDAAMLRRHVYCQVTAQMKAAIDYYYPNDASSDDQKIENAISVVRNHDDVTLLNDTLANCIKYVWMNDKKISNAFMDIESGQINKCALEATTEYFWNHIDRIKHDQYVPNEHDIINVRYPTTGTYICINIIIRVL